MMDFVLIEHSATIYGSEGDSLTVAPHEDGLFRITYHDGDTDPINMILPPEMAMSLGQTASQVVTLNTKKGA